MTSRSAKTTMRQAAYSAHSRLLALTARAARPAEATLILGAPRSGTTWLLELATSAPRSAAVYEPLRPGTDPKLPSTGRVGGFLCPGDLAEANELVDYLSEVLDGRVLSRWSIRGGSVRGHQIANRRVVKLVRACMVASEISASFPTVPIVGIVRDPVAVVNSLWSSPGDWNRWSDEELRSLLGTLPDEAGSRPFAIASERLWLLVLWWIAQARALTRGLHEQHHLLVRYEDLVSRDPQTLGQLFETLRLPTPMNIEELLARPSSTTVPQVERSAGLDQHAREAVLTVASELGVDVSRYRT